MLSVLFILMLSAIVLNVAMQSIIMPKVSDKYEKAYNIDNRMNLTHQGPIL